VTLDRRASAPRGRDAWPAVSIITVNLNNASGLDETIKSISSQSFANWRHIIQDGGSSDASTAVADSYSDPRRTFVSATDDGVYDAMNIGLGHAVGELIWFLNSGDTLRGTRSLEVVTSRYRREPFAWAYGRVRQVAPTSGEWFIHPARDVRPNRVWLGLETYPHPATIYTRALLDSVGGYRPNFGICADQDLCLRCGAVAIPAVFEDVLAEFEPGGMSGTNTALEHERDFHRLRAGNNRLIMRSNLIDDAWTHAMAGLRVLHSAGRRRKARFAGRDT
jgi:glycosyltransferase involved in cell wall biosynthesis